MKNIQYNSEIIDMFDKHARNIMPEIQRTPDRNGISLDRENLSIKFEKIVSHRRYEKTERHFPRIGVSNPK